MNMNAVFLEATNDSLDNYWATTTQVLITLSVATVIEIRILQKNMSRIPFWLQAIQGSLWFIVLGGSCLLLPVTLGASRPDELGPEWLKPASQDLIAAMAGILFLAPAIQVLITNWAGLIFTLGGLFSPAKWRIKRVHRRILRAQRRRKRQSRELKNAYYTGYFVTLKIEEEIESNKEKIIVGREILKGADLSDEERPKLLSWIKWLEGRVDSGEDLLRKYEEKSPRMDKAVDEDALMEQELSILERDARENYARYKDTKKEISQIKADKIRLMFERENAA